jgi:hypothetical protein
MGLNVQRADVQIRSVVSVVRSQLPVILAKVRHDQLGVFLGFLTLVIGSVVPDFVAHCTFLLSLRSGGQTGVVSPEPVLATISPLNTKTRYDPNPLPYRFRRKPHR